ncbi:MAG: hypothetical protein QME79_10100 [Bacillota bacterium]|nr:hypothetical protein [Bacillota bacterium]
MAEERPVGQLQELADKVRQASQGGRVVPLSEVWEGSADEFRSLLADPEAPDCSDIREVPEGDCLYLYSDRYMSRQYAEAAARSAAGDVLRAVAEAVRSDSATYPRPTPVASLAAPPFLLSAEEVLAAAEAMAKDERYQDVRLTTASDGTLFLYSALHLEPAYAESLAEWIAVGQFNSP